MAQCQYGHADNGEDDFILAVRHRSSPRHCTNAKTANGRRQHKAMRQNTLDQRECAKNNGKDQADFMDNRINAQGTARPTPFQGYPSARSAALLTKPPLPNPYGMIRPTLQHYICEYAGWCRIAVTIR
jgi:hypothetical protein